MGAGGSGACGGRRKEGMAVGNAGRGGNGVRSKPPALWRQASAGGRAVKSTPPPPQKEETLLQSCWPGKLSHLSVLKKPHQLLKYLGLSGG